MAQPPAGPTPFDALTGAFGGLLVGHCLTSVANFKVADALGDTPRTAAELAADTGADAVALHRMLRLLAAHGVFACSEDRIAHTPASQLLRADHPHSMCDFLAGIQRGDGRQCTPADRQHHRAGREEKEAASPPPVPGVLRAGGPRITRNRYEEVSTVSGEP